MIVGSHNSWTYLPAKKWWMKIIAFTARCQSLNIRDQYNICGVRCFDLRIKFTKDGFLVIAHGIIEYKYSSLELIKDLEWLNNQSEQVYIRIIHEVRKKKEYTEESIEYFVNQIIFYQCHFTKLKFFCGRNLYNGNHDYMFPEPEPTCSESYSSVCPPKIIDDWWPWLFAYLNNKKIKEKGTNKDILLIDFVNI